MQNTVVRQKAQKILGRPLSTGVTMVFVLLALLGSSSAQEMSAHHHMEPVTNPELMQDWAKARLARSPRHQEWVKVKNGNREVNCFIVYPEVKKKATSVIVIHEIFGLSDWVQALTDEVAEAGYVAIAPDLLSGMGPNGGGSSSFDGTAVRQAIGSLPPDQVTADLNAVADYVAKLPAANGKVAVGGFCWGGSQTFRFATNRPSLKAAFAFYGSAPTTGQAPSQTADKEALGRIGAPVYGFYAENDARINATIPGTTDAMKELGKKYDPVTYAGAGHGFMRAGEAPAPVAPAAKGDQAADEKAAADYQKALTAYQANKKARDDAWERWRKILAGL